MPTISSITPARRRASGRVEPKCRRNTSQELGLPLVTIGNYDARPENPWAVVADSIGTTRAMCDHLVARGAERVGMLTVDIDWSWFTDGVRAYLRWCEERGMEPQLSLARPDKLASSMRDATVDLLDRPNPPDGLFIPPQWLATGLLDIASERGISVPDDLMVGVGVDSGQARGSQPPLTAVDLHAEQIAHEAVTLLMAQIEGVSEIDRYRVVPTELIPRASTLRGDRRAGSSPVRGRP
jgi:DNA-binding LacI/PurR family transcriptional regulator